MCDLYDDYDVDYYVHKIYANGDSLRSIKFYNREIELQSYEDKPAVTTYRKDGVTIEKEKWYQKDILTRYSPSPIRKEENEDLPTVIEYHHNGNIASKTWYSYNGKIHRGSYSPSCKDEKEKSETKPAVIEYDENGNLICEVWYQNGKIHRDNDEPAVIEYYNDGTISAKKWFKHDDQHRDEGKPAYIAYYPGGEGKIKEEGWFIDDEEIDLKYYDIPK